MEHLEELVWGTQKCLLKPNEGGHEGGLQKTPICAQTAKLAWDWNKSAGSHLMVPLKRTGSCRMMDRRERSVCSGSLAMSMPSMMMRPVW